MKTSSFHFLFLLISINVFSQKENSIFASTIWIKPIEKNTTGEMEKEKLKTKLFNFNPTVDFVLDKVSQKFKNTIEKQSSLFVVFKSTVTDENELLVLNNGSLLTSLTNQKIIQDKGIFLNKGNPQQGTIVSFLYNKNSIIGKKKGSLLFSDFLFNDTEGKNELLELIYVPKVLNEGEKNMVESYLSIKYGISLSPEKSYYNSAGSLIWEAEKNAGFNKRVTGIGRDDRLGLHQKQSGNSEKDGLYIGCNKIETSNQKNQSQLKDKDYFIWGDNGKPATIIQKENETSLHKMPRVWKINTTSDDSGIATEFTTQLLINKSEMMVRKVENESDEKKFLWLAIDSTDSNEFNYSSAKYIKASTENNQTVTFNSVKWKANSQYKFTFIEAADFFIALDVTQASCSARENGSIKFQIIGGSAPYTISLKSKSSNKEFTSNTNEVQIDQLGNDSFQLIVSDQNHTETIPFTLDNFSADLISLKEEYYLVNNEVEVIPTTNTASDLSFQWVLNDTILATDSEFTAQKTGDYILKVTNTEGCTKDFPFKVKEKENSINSKWAVYPNPAKSNDNFTISFSLSNPTQVSITITDINGKVIKSKDLGEIKNYKYNESLSAAGTYLVVANIGGTKETSKLIIK